MRGVGRGRKSIDEKPCIPSMVRMRDPNMLRFALGLLMLAVAGCLATRGNVYPLSEGYLPAEGVFARCQRISALAPELVRLHIIGFSGTEHLPIYALEIGTPQAGRNVLLSGQHHGDEVLGVEIVLDWAEELAVRGSKDKHLSEILSQFRFWIVPSINPEGHRVVSSGLQQFKRKNNRETTGDGKLDLRADGVDLNRNYPVFWDEDLALPPTHQNFKGTAPASEPEVQAVVGLAQKHSFELAMFYHSSPTGELSEKIFLPALDSLNTRQKLRWQTTKSLADEYASNLKRDYQDGSYAVSPIPGTRVGNARNYFFHIREAYAFLIEVGGVTPDGISIVHPPAKMRDRIVARHLKALRKLFAYNLMTLV